VAGVCPNELGTTLYETDEVEVSPENFARTFVGLGLFCGCLMVAFGVLTLRLRRRARLVSAEAVDLGASDSEALMCSAIE